MRILAISDIHGELYKTKKLLALVESREPDLIVVAGDITRFGPAKAAYDIFDALKKTNRRIVAITGNADSRDVERIIRKKDLDIHNKAVVIDKIGFVGFSGPTTLQMGNFAITNYDRINYTLADLSGCERRVLVSHVPPSNTKLDAVFSGEHVGSDFLRDVIEEAQPNLVICGHIHEARGVDRIGKTTIINPGALCDGYAAMIELGENGEVSHEMLSV